MMKKRSWFYGISLALLVCLLLPVSARADVAPPESPPGVTLLPGAETTQVRMMAETVTMTVLATPSAGSLAQAKTEAVFTMRNLGAQAETMDARFPLTFWNGQSDGFFNYPEIGGISIKVDGRTVATQRVTTANEYDSTAPPVPWAAFNVTFPPGQDVIIQVNYMADGFGYPEGSYAAFKYVLETGAGWKDSIGSADIILRLPYEANPMNVMLYDANSWGTGFSETTPGAQLSASEARWHFENLEPTSENNIEITILTPQAWRALQEKIALAQKYPNDGETWGQVGKAYKTALRIGHGDMRRDAVGESMYQEGVAAYQKSVDLLPDDALWHYGFADLLLLHYERSSSRQQSELIKIVDELHKCLALDPKNQNALDLVSWISGSMPEYIHCENGTCDYLALTAIPSTPTEFPLPDTETPPAILPTSTAYVVTNTPSASLPTPARARRRQFAALWRDGADIACAGGHLAVSAQVQVLTRFILRLPQTANFT
jgi:tetratricopeptide (TPR) repeat protein